jgi:hypothetical protein
VTLTPRRLADADPLTTHRIKQTDASVSLQANQFHEFESHLAAHPG